MKGMLNKAFSIALLISALPMVAMESVSQEVINSEAAQGSIAKAREFVSSNYKSASEAVSNGYNDHVAPRLTTAATKASEATMYVVDGVKAHPYAAGVVVAGGALVAGSFIYGYKKPAVKSDLAHDLAIFKDMQKSMSKNEAIETPNFKIADKVVYKNGNSADLFKKVIREYNTVIGLFSLANHSGITLDEVKNVKENVDKTIAFITKELQTNDKQIQEAKKPAVSLSAPVSAASVSSSVTPALVAPKAAPQRKAPVAPTVVVKKPYSRTTKVLVATGLLASIGASTFALYNYFFKSPVA